VLPAGRRIVTRAGIAACGVVIVLAVAVVVAIVPQPAPPVVAPVVATPQETVHAPVVEPAVATPPVEATVDDESASDSELPPEGFAALVARARAGDVEAMTRLGQAVLPCHKVEHERRMRELARLDGGSLPAATRDDLRDALRETVALCEAAPPEERDRGYAWIEAAAIAGEATARRLFFSVALDEFVDDAAIVANIDEVERRRDLARRFAREDLAACVPGVFATQSLAFDLLGMTDPADQLAIYYAHSLTERLPDSVLAHSPNARTISSAVFEAQASEADELVVIEGKRRGAALHAHCAP
jgi:hypothetical protein